jgi:hypothetical protein
MTTLTITLLNISASKSSMILQIINERCHVLLCCGE